MTRLASGICIQMRMGWFVFRLGIFYYIKKCSTFLSFLDWPWPFKWPFNASWIFLLLLRNAWKCFDWNYPAFFSNERSSTVKLAEPYPANDMQDQRLIWFVKSCQGLKLKLRQSMSKTKVTSKVINDLITLIFL